MKNMGSKENFLKIYSSLPMGVRGEIILVLEGKPITWDVSYIEVDQDTKLGETILEKLEDLNLRIKLK